MNTLHVEKNRLLDADGRQVILNGLNLVCKQPEFGYVYPLEEQDYCRLASQGINVFRFGIFWAGVEPRPGDYDEKYLERIRHQLKLAEKAGILIFLDFHQDLYGVSFSDGAPEWAEITDGLPNVSGDLWSDAYLISPAINRAIENFWNNVPAEDGMGLMDHYVQMLAHTAAYFSDVPNLIGYDIMNEPYPGTLGQKALSAIMSAFPAAENVQLENQAEKAELIRALKDMPLYHHLTEIGGEYTAPWEETVLTNFYTKAADAIQNQMPDALIFTNPCYFTNMGIPCGLKHLNDQQVLSPHGYDLVVDTSMSDLYDSGRVDWIFRQHKKTAEKLNVPVIVGEWGAFYGNPGNEAAAEQVIRILEQNFWSQTYWDWTPKIETYPEWKYLSRGYPVKTAGTPEFYCWKNGCFQMTWISNGSETEIFIPELGSKQVSILQGTAAYRVVQNRLFVCGKDGERIQIEVR